MNQNIILQFLERVKNLYVKASPAACLSSWLPLLCSLPPDPDILIHRKMIICRDESEDHWVESFFIISMFGIFALFTS